MDCFRKTGRSALKNISIPTYKNKGKNQTPLPFPLSRKNLFIDNEYLTLKHNDYEKINKETANTP